MASKKSESAGDGALTLEHSSEQYTNEYDQFASIEAELECMNAEEVTTTEEEITVEEHVETEEVISPDIEMTDVSEEVEEVETVYKPVTKVNQNVFQTKPTYQRVPVSPAQVSTQVALLGILFNGNYNN